MTELTIMRRITIDAEPGAAWRAISSPAGLASWLEEDIDLEVRPGCTGRIGRRSVIVTEVDEERRRVSWLWTDENDDAPSSVDLAITTVHDGIEVTVVERSAVPIVPMASAQARLEMLASGLWSARV